MLKTLVYICLTLGAVNCGSNLCKNGGKIDAITYVTGKNMYFFTSGGHYWYVKAEEFPPTMPGTPLPGGFQKGDAAVYRNTLDACASVQSTKAKPQEQEIHLIELVNGENKILIFDTRTNMWTNENNPTSYREDKGLGQAKVDWTKSIDAAFTYKMTNIVVIQGSRYSIVDIMNVCKGPDGWGEGKQSRPTTDLNVQGIVDSTSDLDNKYFYLFQGTAFWKIEITGVKSSEGRLMTVKNVQDDVITVFFKLPEDCRLPEASTVEAAPIPPGVGPAGEAASEAPENKPDAPPTPPQENPDGAGGQGEGDKSNKDDGKKDEGGFPWIIIIIIVIIIVLIAIVLIACLAMKKGKGKDAEAGQDVAPGAAGGSKAGKSSTGNSPSGMSLRSGVGKGEGGASGSKAGSTVGGSASKAGSKAGGKGGMAMSSSMGHSPSTMSVRSNAGLATSGSKIKSKS